MTPNQHAILIAVSFLSICPKGESAMPEPNRVVTISTICLLDGKEHRNQDYVLSMIRTACERGRSDLVVVPFTPFLEFRQARASADLAAFAELAKKHRTYLAVALVEKARGDSTFYTSVLFDRTGKIVGKYRKTHALPDDKIDLGDDIPVFKTDFGVLGLSIGTDFYFPELYSVESMKGAEILVWQHFPERFREHFQWRPLLKARCMDSHAHTVVAMYADPRAYITNRYKYGMQGAAWGRSMILNRVGTPIADTGFEDGVATAIVDLDKRKAGTGEMWCRSENVFFCNSVGDRTAFKPIAKPWRKPRLPRYKKRKARVAVGYFWPDDMWRNNGLPKAMLRVLDEAAKCNPDVVLLSEMSARQDNENNRKVCELVAERARKMNSYIIIGGVGFQHPLSVARVWDRKGKVVFEEPIYWTKGFPEIKIYDTDFARIGIHTCGDLYTGEIDRVLALKGAEIIFDPSQMWGADGYHNEMLLRARAIDNGCWVACAHWVSSDVSLRSVIVDPYGMVVAASMYQTTGVVHVDVDFNDKKVYYEGCKPKQRKRGPKGIPSYFTEDMPEQKPGWRDMIFRRRRPELYGIIPTVNDVIMKYRPEKGLY